MKGKKSEDRQFPLPLKGAGIPGNGEVVTGRFKAANAHLGAVYRRLENSGIFGTKHSRSRT